MFIGKVRNIVYRVLLLQSLLLLEIVAVNEATLLENHGFRPIEDKVFSETSLKFNFSQYSTINNSVEKTIIIGSEKFNMNTTHSYDILPTSRIEIISVSEKSETSKRSTKDLNKAGIQSKSDSTLGVMTPTKDTPDENPNYNENIGQNYNQNVNKNINDKIEKKTTVGQEGTRSKDQGYNIPMYPPLGTLGPYGEHWFPEEYKNNHRKLDRYGSQVTTSCLL